MGRNNPSVQFLFQVLPLRRKASLGKKLFNCSSNQTKPPKDLDHPVLAAATVFLGFSWERSPRQPRTEPPEPVPDCSLDLLPYGRPLRRLLPHKVTVPAPEHVLEIHIVENRESLRTFEEIRESFEEPTTGKKGGRKASLVRKGQIDGPVGELRISFD